PEMGNGVLALARPFLKTILSRLTQDTIAELVETDSSLFEFIVVSILERANRELRFPVQCLLVPSSKFALQDESGVTLEASIRLVHAQGSILLFLPGSCLQKLENMPSIGLPASLKEGITWQITVRVGFVDLAANDLEDLEPADTLLYSPEIELVLPADMGGHTPERGWRAVQSESKPNCFEIREFFERSVHMEESPNLLNEQNEVKADRKIELADLPVRIHVVLSQVELSLKELEGLTDGSIIQLDEEHRGAVQLVANGNVLGAGDLVEIDDRLGVHISRWRKG